MEHEEWRVEQSRLLVRGCPKALAADLGVALDTVYRWKHGAWPVPAYQAFRLSQLQQDFSFLQTLAVRSARMIVTRPPCTPTPAPALVLATVAAIAGEVIKVIIEKMEHGLPLTDDEAQHLNGLIDQGEAQFEQLREIVRRHPRTRKEHGNGHHR